jgi:hypothetical protein
MKGLKKTWRSDGFKLLSWIAVAFCHIFLNVGPHTFPKEGLPYIVVSFENPTWLAVGES